MSLGIVASRYKHTYTHTYTLTHSRTHTRTHKITTNFTIIVAKGINHTVVGHLVKGMVVVLKTKDSRPILGVIKSINDAIVPRPTFQMDVLDGTADAPLFYHGYDAPMFGKDIIKVCVYRVY
jgi:hypothetical protein